jgi:hypothetical protein
MLNVHILIRSPFTCWSRRLLAPVILTLNTRARRLRSTNRQYTYPHEKNIVFQDTKAGTRQGLGGNHTCFVGFRGSRRISECGRMISPIGPCRDRFSVRTENSQISVEIVAPHNIPKAGCSEGKTKNTMSTNLPCDFGGMDLPYETLP